MTNKYMYFIANWKMFGDLNSLNSLNSVINFSNKLKKKKLKIIYCPPATLLHAISKKLKKTKIDVGAQNCHQLDSYGAFTGSLNSSMLRNVGAKYIIIGHSENRKTGDNDMLINLKIKSALKSGLKVIFCIGESLKDKRNKNTNKTLSKQIQTGLRKIRNKKDIIIAYEPFWAIGSGQIPKLSGLSKTISFIKNKNKNSKVLYGGSVNSKNISELKKIEIIDGFLVGGASQHSKKFIDIIKKIYS